MTLVQVAVHALLKGVALLVPVLVLPQNYLVLDPLVEPAHHMHARVMPVAQETSVVYVAVVQETSVVHVVRAVRVDHPKSLARKPLLETLIPCTSTTQ